LNKNKMSFEGTFKFSIKQFGHVYKDLFNTVLFPTTEEGTAAAAEQTGNTAAPVTPAANRNVANVTPANGFITAAALMQANTAMKEDATENEQRILGGRVEVTIHQWLTGIHRVIEKYEEQKEIAARHQRMKQAATRLANTAQAKSVSNALADEAAVSPATLAALIQKEVKAANKERDDKIAELEKKLAVKQSPKSILKSGEKSNNAKKETGAATGDGAKQRNRASRSTNRSTSKQRERKDQKAKGSASGTPSGASRRGRSCSTVRQQQRRGKSKGQRSTGSNALRQN
jgi:hypothetical protein